MQIRELLNFKQVNLILCKREYFSHKYPLLINSQRVFDLFNLHFILKIYFTFTSGRVLNLVLL